MIFSKAARLAPAKDGARVLEKRSEGGKRGGRKKPTINQSKSIFSHRRERGGTELTWTSALTQDLHDPLTGSGVATGGSTHRFPEGAVDDVDLPPGPGVFVRASSRLPHQTGRVALVCQERIHRSIDA